MAGGIAILEARQGLTSASATSAQGVSYAPKYGLRNDYDYIVAEWPLNEARKFSRSLSEFNGQPVVDARVWFNDGTGRVRPGKKGITVGVKQLPNLAEAMAKALAEVEDRGPASRRAAARELQNSPQLRAQAAIGPLRTRGFLHDGWSCRHGEHCLRLRGRSLSKSSRVTAEAATARWSGPYEKPQKFFTSPKLQPPEADVICLAHKEEFAYREVAVQRQPYSTLACKKNYPRWLE